MLIRWQTNEGQVVYLAASHVTAAYVTQREEGEEYIVCTELGIENVYLALYTLCTLHLLLSVLRKQQLREKQQDVQ